MELEFHNLLPDPLAGYTFQPDSFWQSGSFLFEPGKFYDIHAHSGKGKTTILDIIYGKRKDYTGKYGIGGKSVRQMGVDDWSYLRKNSISYVFQGLRLFPKLTGRDNIAIKNKLTGYLSDDKMEKLAEKLEIDQHLNKRSAHMSFGQRQRLSLIRALAQPFEWLLLDEPFSHLDKVMSERVTEIILNECTSRGAGLIVSRLDDRQYIECNKTIVL